MAPNIRTFSENLIAPIEADKLIHKSSSDPNPKTTLVWKNVFLFAYLHIAACYGLYLFCTGSKWQTMLFSEFVLKIL